VWAAANEHTADGVFYGIDLFGLDDISSINGVGEAMASVGWANYDESSNSVSLPNFLEHNEPSRVRMPKTNAQRQMEYRERKKAVTASNACYGREEKRREEKKKKYPPTPKGGDGGVDSQLSSAPENSPPRESQNPAACGAPAREPEPAKLSRARPKAPDCDPLAMPMPPELATPAFRRSWSEWIDYRRDRRLSLRALTLAKQLAMLASFGEAGAIKVIDQSIRNGWQGLFEVRGERTVSPIGERLVLPELGNDRNGVPPMGPASRQPLPDALGG